MVRSWKCNLSVAERDYRIVWEQMPLHSVKVASEVWVTGGKLGVLHGGIKAITARLRQVENELSDKFLSKVFRFLEQFLAQSQFGTIDPIYSA